MHPGVRLHRGTSHQTFMGSVARGLLSTAKPDATPPSSTPRSLVRTRKPAGRLISTRLRWGEYDWVSFRLRVTKWVALHLRPPASVWRLFKKSGSRHPKTQRARRKAASNQKKGPSNTKSGAVRHPLLALRNVE